MPTRKDIKALLAALFQSQTSTATAPDLSSLFYRELSGGYSGAFVAIVWLDQFPTLILKAGPSGDILGETEARQLFESPALASMRALGLTDCSEPVEIEVEGRDELWRAMVYAYIGGLSYDELPDFSDFQLIFEDFIAPQREERRPSAQALRSWLNRLCEQIEKRQSDLAGGKPQGVRAKPLSEFLPILPWRNGLTAILESAAAYAPEPADLHSLREWWETSIEKESLASYPNRTLLHGDLRFANILVNRTTAAVELIDFGNATEGHVFRDLARFECDLLFRITPPPAETRTLRLSSEDRRIRMFECAFDAENGHLQDRDDPDNPALAALRIVRDVYDRYWRISSDEARRRMYSWFLLAEVLKRLMWTGEIFSTIAGRQALLCAVVMLKRAVMGEPVAAPSFGVISGLSRLLSCTAVYVPTRAREASVNRSRNAAKARALQDAAARKSSVKLLAETGNSYLHFRGPFFPEVEALISSASLQVVLANPSFVESHGISAAYQDRLNLDDLGIHSLLRQKFAESLAGYELLRTQEQNGIEVRVSRYGIGGTLLMTDDVIFFEPYLRSDRTRRHQRLFETFELRFSAQNSHVRDLFNQHFAFYWTASDPFEKLAANEVAYRSLLSSLEMIWSEPNG
jgi:Phosphotransferase enzyme family